MSILSYRVDPHGVLSLVRQLAPRARASGEGTTWQRLEVPPSPAPVKGLDARSTLVLTHAPESYCGNGWSDTISDLRERCKGFPPTGRTPEVVRALSGVGFRVDLGPGCVVDLDTDPPDELSAIVLAIAEHLDAFLLTPSSVRDRRGRVLIGDEPCDPNATLPAGAASIPASELHRPEIGSRAPDVDPSPERVAFRALALAAVSSRAFLEQMDPDKVDLAFEHARLRAWVDAVGLGAELEPDEWQLLQAPVFWVDERVAVDAAWRLEGLTVLAWALGLVDLPRYDAMVRPTELFPVVGFLDPDAGARLATGSRLADPVTVEKVRCQLLTVRWRIREFRLTGKCLDLTTAPTLTRLGKLDFSACRLIDGDLAIGRLPIDITPADQIKRVDDIVLERLEALTWLQEGGTYAHVTLPM